MVTYDDDGNPVLTEEDMSWGSTTEESDSERKITLLEPRRIIEVSELGSSPKRILNAAVALGWRTQASVSLTRVAPVLFVHNSAEGSSNQHSAGDVRYDGFESRNYCVEARRDRMLLGFQAYWTGTSRDSSAKSATFDYAFVYDPVGVPVENYYEYKPQPMTRQKFETQDGFEARVEQARRNAQIANERYNDGTFRNEKFHMFKQAGPFDAWLSDWLELAGLDSIVRKKAPTKAEKNQSALLEGGEWNG